MKLYVFADKIPEKCVECDFICYDTGEECSVCGLSGREVNKMVRRKVPKGTNFDDMTDAEVEEMENWINNYPRRIHDYHSAGELFKEEVRKIG